MTDLPAAFVERVRTYVDDPDALLAALDAPAVHGGRVNPRKMTRDELGAVLEVELGAVPWCDDSFVLPPTVALGAHPLHTAGAFYLQEPSAALAVVALDPQPGERVLDLCAAPGGKTTQIASLVGPTGTVVANDVTSTRARKLVGNLDRWGTGTVVTTSHPARLVDTWGEHFDRVLIDAPCSGEGLFRREPEARGHWSVEHVVGSAARQREVIEDGAALVAPGGVLVYSTCTFSPEEDEAIVDGFLGAHTDWSFEPIDAAPGVTIDTTRGTARIWPHRGPGEGQFVARLRAPGTRAADNPPNRRASDPETRGRTDTSSHQPAAADMLASWRTFAEAHLGGFTPPGTIVAAGDTLYAAPDDVDLRGLGVLRPGLPLGRVRPGRFEPTAALAHAIDDAVAVQRVDLHGHDLAQYARGEAVTVPGASGWIVVTTAGCALGWGRAKSGVVRSMFPKPWRNWVTVR